MPARYTVGAGNELVHTLPDASGNADIFVLGPNGFHRRLTGRSDVFAAAFDDSELLLESLTSAPLSVAMTDRAYGASPAAIELSAGQTRRVPLDLAKSHGWYDRQFAASGQTWRMAGCVETGEASYSDPALGGKGPLGVSQLTDPTRGGMASAIATPLGGEPSDGLTLHRAV